MSVWSSRPVAPDRGLRNRVEELEEEVRQLRATIRDLTRPILAIEGLSAQEGDLVATLARRPGIPFPFDLMARLICRRTDAPGRHHFSVIVCRIRKKRPDILIQTRFGLGYAIERPLPADVAAAVGAGKIDKRGA